MSTATTRIELTASFNPKGFDDAKRGVDDLAKYTDNVRRNQLFRSGRGEAAAGLNLFRQGSDVFTQGLSGTSPFTIAIQQGPQVIDILLSGAMSAGKFATALAGIGVGVAGVMGAIDSYQKMTEAINDATAAQNRLNESRNFIQRDIAGGMGIAPKQGPEALERLTQRFQELEAERNRILFEEAPAIARLKNEGPGSAFVGTPLGRKRETPETILRESKSLQERLAQIDLQMSLISKAFTRVSTGLAEIEGGKRLFSENISPGALAMMRQREIQEEAKTTTLEEIKTRRMRIDALTQTADRLQGKEKADLLNTVYELTTNLDMLSKAVEQRAKEQMEWDSITSESRKQFERERLRAVEPVKTEAITASIVSARQAIGGMANAPILSNFQKQTELLKNIAETSRQTAANTARGTPPAAPVSNPDSPMSWPTFYTTFN